MQKKRSVWSKDPDIGQSHQNNRSENREPKSRRYFKFKPEFGWSELISIGAFVLSIWAVMIARSQAKDAVATIHIGEPEVQVFGARNDSIKKMETVVYFRIPVENKGGRATTLMQISGLDRDRWVEPLGGGQYRTDLPIIADLLVAPETFSMRVHDISEWKKLRWSAGSIPLHPGWDVPGGQGRDLILLAMFDADQFPPQLRKHGRVRLHLEFSNGETIPFEATFALMGEVPPPATKPSS